MLFIEAGKPGEKHELLITSYAHAWLVSVLGTYNIIGLRMLKSNFEFHIGFMQLAD